MEGEGGVGELTRPLAQIPKMPLAQPFEQKAQMKNKKKIDENLPTFVSIWCTGNEWMNE